MSMKRCRYLIEIPDQDRKGWVQIAKTDTEGNAALIAYAVAQYIEAGTARYTIGGRGSVHYYRKEQTQ